MFVIKKDFIYTWMCAMYG